MSDKSPFNAHDACLKIELPCDQRFLQMFEQFTLKVSQSFGYRGGAVDEFSQLISGLTGTVLKASELMPFSHLSTSAKTASLPRISQKGGTAKRQASVSQQTKSLLQLEQALWNNIIKCLKM